MTRIIPADHKDIQLLAELENQVFSCDRISRRQFRYLLTKANSIIIKAELDGKLSGYLVLLKRKTSSNLRIYSIGVAKRARKQGIAGRLLAHAEKIALAHHCSQLTLEVCEQNSTALQFYHGIGFHQHGRKIKYYEDGCTALLLHKNIALKDTLQ